MIRDFRGSMLMCYLRLGECFEENLSMLPSGLHSDCKNLIALEYISLGDSFSLKHYSRLK